MTARWRPSDRQRSLFTLAALGLFLATTTQRPIIVVLVVPAAVLLLVPRRPRRTAVPAIAKTAVTAPTAPTAEATVVAHSEVSPQRCLEGETVELVVTVQSGEPLERLDLTLHLSESVEALDAPVAVSLLAPRHEERLQWRLRLDRWGRRSVGALDITAHRAGGLSVATFRTALCDVSVYPHHAPLTLMPTPRALPDRFGDHVSVVAGDGVEFIEVNDFRAGDRTRRINWRATARRGTLQVNRTAAERACDVVLLIDAFSDVGGRERSSLDVAVRGAVATARAYIARHDRVGLIVLGGRLMWLGPEIGGRQFYRVIENILDARRANAADHPELGVIPPSALPSGSLALLFSPLLDPRAVVAIHALRRRGLSPVVIDVRTAAPQVQPEVPNSQLAVRLWNVEHHLRLRALEDSGVPVIGWDGADLLDVAFSKLPHHRRSA